MPVQVVSSKSITTELQKQARAFPPASYHLWHTIGRHLDSTKVQQDISIWG
jgi:hypothetical protein